MLIQSQKRRGYNAFMVRWQKLTAFRQTQKWPHNFCKVRFCDFRDKFVLFARNCNFVDLIHWDKIAYIRAKNFRLSPNFSVKALRSFAQRLPACFMEYFVWHT